MKTAIVYYSKHHGNTKKLLDAIAGENEVTLIDVAEAASAELTQYDRIGFASGIYFSKFHKTLLAFAQENMPQDKETFFIYTCGSDKKGYTDAIAEAASMHGAKILGEFACRGYDTYGPFKLVGGIAKGHPDEEDIKNACEFYRNL